MCKSGKWPTPFFVVYLNSHHWKINVESLFPVRLQTRASGLRWCVRNSAKKLTFFKLWRKKFNWGNLIKLLKCCNCLNVLRMLQITFYSFGFRSFDSSIILAYILYSTYAKLTFGERFCKINFCHTSFRTFWDEFSYMLVMIDCWTTILIIFWENLNLWSMKTQANKTTCLQIDFTKTKREIE